MAVDKPVPVLCVGGGVMLTKEQEAEARLSQRMCMKYSRTRTATMVGGEYRCGEDVAMLLLSDGPPSMESTYFLHCQRHGRLTFNDTEVG